MRKISQARILPPEKPGQVGNLREKPIVSQPKGPGPKGGAPDPGAYVGLGIQFAAGILLFTFLGSWLDDRLGTSPWLLMVGVFGGFALSMFWIYRRLVIVPREREGERKEGEKGP